MAIDKATFRTRTITAVIFAVVMLAGLFINVWSMILLFAIIMFGCLYEVAKISKLISRNYLMLMPVAFVYIVLPILLLIDLGVDTRLAPSGMDLAKSDYYSPLFPCAVIFSIWINDTMAYLVGSQIGKTPLSVISPKKTWEGTIGGIILCVLVIAILGYTVPAAKYVELRHWICIAIISAGFGTIGDLIESKLKRMAGIKDSGRIMPGHGGFLDRFDSLLVAAPFVWLYCKLIM